jgi:hypothetical protein
MANAGATPGVRPITWASVLTPEREANLHSKAGCQGAYRPFSVAGVEYRYELRRADEVVATGHLSREQPLEIGDRIEIGGQSAIVRTIEPLLGESEQRLVLRLLLDRS